MPRCPFVQLILQSNGQKAPKSGAFKNEGIHEGPGISTIPFHLVVVQILAIDVAQHRKHGLAYAARTAFQISGAVLPLTLGLASSN
jgi:hypothetical protein